jgi:hypothetical protein
MEAIFNAFNHPRPRVLGTNEKLIEFLRMKPPTLGGSVNPLDADDWLRAILRELKPFNCEDRDKVLLATHQLTGTALAWRENYCAVAKDPSAITWDEFVEEFRRYHIPEATLKRKADDFRELRQGNKSVEEYTYQFIELARYAPEEVDKDSKKQDVTPQVLNNPNRRSTRLTVVKSRSTWVLTSKNSPTNSIEPFGLMDTHVGPTHGQRLGQTPLKP